MGLCQLNFDADILRYHESLPCREHAFTYRTLAEGERAANAELIDVKRVFGSAAGYVILDESGLEVSSGGGRRK